MVADGLCLHPTNAAHCGNGSTTCCPREYDAEEEEEEEEEEEGGEGGEGSRRSAWRTDDASVSSPLVCGEQGLD